MAIKTQKKTAKDQGEIKWPFGPKNYLVFAIALAVIIVGYITLGYGSITIAPILLVLGYCVLVPIAIIIRGRPDEESTESDRDAIDIGTK